jgi:hypothetical protein
MKFVFATTAALATLALGQQHLLSLETVGSLADQQLLSLGVGDGHIIQTFELEVDATHHTEYWNIPDGGVHQYGSIPPGGGHHTIYRHDGHIEYVNHLKVTPIQTVLLSYLLHQGWRRPYGLE